MMTARDIIVKDLVDRSLSPRKYARENADLILAALKKAGFVVVPPIFKGATIVFDDTSLKIVDAHDGKLVVKIVANAPADA
jgi:hypothetical protein